jgi:hypothetical protein
VLLTGYCLTDEVKEAEMGGACGIYREENVCRVVVEEKRKKPLSRHKLRWGCDIKMDLIKLEISCLRQLLFLFN